MRAPWALEEVGQPYDVRLVSFEAMKRSAHLRLQPFGQIPTYEDGPLALFESGAIILHIAETRMRGCCRAMPWDVGGVMGRLAPQFPCVTLCL
jgi:glutathione S-transferase